MDFVSGAEIQLVYLYVHDVISHIARCDRMIAKKW